MARGIRALTKRRDTVVSRRGGLVSQTIASNGPT
jgi:hypothetical protein